MNYILAGMSFVLQHVLKVLAVGTFHNRRVVFFSYFGKQYSCNPKYLCEYLMQASPEYEIVWAFAKPEDFAWLEQRGMHIVRYNSLAFARACLTSGFVVTNSQLPAWFPVLRRMHIINTWHGGGAYKRVGTGFLRASKGKQLMDALSRHKPCVYLSSSKAFTQLTIRQSFEHEGEVLECGMPRNDLLVRQSTPEVTQRVKERLGIDPDTRILLYAPTYREDREISSDYFDLNIARDALARRFGGTWTIVFRLHYLVAGKLPATQDYVDASTYPDMQELLYAADVLLTDYSSSIWDFGLTGRPCFLYVPDLDEFDLQRGFYSDIRTWPWPLAQTKDELARNVLEFDEQAFARKLEQHYEDLGSTDTGHACEAVANWMAAVEQR